MTVLQPPFAEIGVVLSASVWRQFSTDGSPVVLWMYSSEQYCVHRFSIYRFRVRHLPEQYWIIVAFHFFHCSLVFHELVYPLAVFLPQIFFSLTALFSYPISFAFFMHLLIMLFMCLYSSDLQVRIFSFFLSSLLLSHRSRISAVTKVFFAGGVCHGSHWLFQSLLCWRRWSSTPCLNLHCSW